MAFFKIVWDNEHGFEGVDSGRELTSFREFSWSSLDDAGKEDLVSRAEEELEKAGLDGCVEMDEATAELVAEIFDEFDYVRAVSLLPALEGLLDSLLPPKPVPSPAEIDRSSSLHSDAFKNPIFVGDEVAAIMPSYRELVLGKVVALTPKKVRVEWTRGRSKDVFLADPRNVVKKL